MLSPGGTSAFQEQAGDRTWLSSSAFSSATAAKTHSRERADDGGFVQHPYCP